MITIQNFEVVQVNRLQMATVNIDEIQFPDRAEFKRIKALGGLIQANDRFEFQGSPLLVLEGLKEKVLSIVFLSKSQIIAQVNCL